MEAGECVLPAARAVLELLEREWQPLSPGELELRLDQAVEESLEAELVAGLQARPPPACCWLQEGPHDREAALLGRASPAAAASSSRTPVEGTPEARDRQQDAGAAAVQVPFRVPLTRKITCNNNNINKTRINKKKKTFN